jgi:hypothetical protein
MKILLIGCGGNRTARRPIQLGACEGERRLINADFSSNPTNP